MAHIGEKIMDFGTRNFVKGGIKGKLWENSRFILADVPLKAA